MLIAGVVAGIVLIVVWVVRRSDGRYRFRPSFEAACEVTVGGRRLVAYSGHRKVIRLSDPATREDTAVGDPHGLAHLDPYAVCEVDVDGRPLLASGGRDGVVRLWDLENRGARVASLTGHRGWVYGLCTVRVSGPRHAGLSGPGRRDMHLGQARRPAGAHDRHRPPEGVDHRPVSGADGRANAARGRAPGRATAGRPMTGT
ncbi:hypothetical protein AB0H69_43030 [Streptomyces phaeochromogenes]